MWWWPYICILFINYYCIPIFLWYIRVGYGIGLTWNQQDSYRDKTSTELSRQKLFWTCILRQFCPNFLAPLSHHAFPSLCNASPVRIMPSYCTHLLTRPWTLDDFLTTTNWAFKPAMLYSVWYSNQPRCQARVDPSTARRQAEYQAATKIMTMDSCA